MERVLNPRLEKDIIYEIYRGCRLCGAGAGYKMPIIQNVIDLDDDGVKLSQKIRETIQIEVHQDDKMPPLICELCVDKVNDFYEFMTMCHRTNKQTRMKLGLPYQTASKAAPDQRETNDCILGDTSPIYINDDSDGEPLASHKIKAEDKKSDKSLKGRGTEIWNKIDHNPKEGKLTKSSPFKQSLTPVRVTRLSNYAQNKDVSISASQDQSRRSRPGPKSMVNEKELKAATVVIEEDNSLLVPRLKRPRERDAHVVVPPKKNKSSTETPKPPSKASKPPQKSSKPPAKTSTPSAKVSGPTAKTSPLSAKASGPGTKSAAPSAKASWPSAKTLAPQAKASGPSTKSSAPSAKASGPSSKTSAKASGPSAKASPLPSRSAKQTSSPASSGKRSSSPISVEEAASYEYLCMICRASLKNVKLYSSHMRIHTVSFTNSKLACNACGEWFNNSEEMSAHHRRHRTAGQPYRCRRCTAEFVRQEAYDRHFGENQCIPWDEVPDVRCHFCWRYFATDNLLIEHKCAGEDGRQGGKCVHCNRTYILLKNLIKHTAMCMHKKKNNAVVDPEVLERIKPLQVRVARCDPLLQNPTPDHYDVSKVSGDFGLDRNCVYPYMTSMKRVHIKLEPVLIEYDSMVSIKEEIKEEICSDEQYVHWDSDCSEDEPAFGSTLVTNPIANGKKVDSLGVLSLKTIFSQKLLGKVPKKRRKIKMEAFDSMFNDSSDIRLDIDSIIGKLDSDVDRVSVKDGKVDKEILGGKDRDGLTKVHALADDRNGDVSDTDSYSLLDGTQSHVGDNNGELSKFDGDKSKDNLVHNNVTEHDIHTKNKCNNDNTDTNTDQNTISDSHLVQNDAGKSKVIDEDTNSFKDIDASMEIVQNEAAQGEKSKDNENTETPNHNGASTINENNISGQDHEITDENVSDAIQEQDGAIHDDISMNEMENYTAPQDTQTIEQIESKDKDNEIINVCRNNQDSVNVDKTNDTNTEIDNRISPTHSNVRVESIDSIKNDSIEENPKNSDGNKLETVNEEIRDGDANKLDTVEKINNTRDYDGYRPESDGLEDVSDTELDDMALMEELDAQIGDNGDGNSNSEFNHSNEISNEACEDSERNATDNASDGDNEKFKKSGDVEGNNKEFNEESNLSEQDGSHDATHENDQFGDDRAMENDVTNKDVNIKSDENFGNGMLQNVTVSYNNEIEGKDKIALEDLLTTRDSESMDLDSISDDEFDYDL